MMKKVCIFISVALLLLSALAFCFGCQNKYEKVVDYSLVAADASALSELDLYPNLQTLDLRGSDCYEAIADYIASHPQVSVQYDVLIGNDRYSSDICELSFADGAYDYDQLLENLAYLPDVSRIELPRTSLSAEQLSAFSTAYPDVKVDYTVMILGKEIPSDVSELDLSSMKPAQIDEIAEPVAKLTGLRSIQLMSSDGSSNFAPVDVKNLMDAFPGIDINYTFDLFGQTISTADESVEYVMVKIGEEGLPQIREALDILPKCTYFKLDRCGIGTPEMAKLREDYPNVKVVWRVYFSDANCLTDVEMVHCTGGVINSEVQALKYCTDIKYLDLGHNPEMSNISFISHLSKLKIAIIADCSTDTLEPFANCPDLEILEIVDCRRLTDLSPLASCTKLKGLNLSSSYGIKDLTPLHELKDLERLYLGANKVPKKQIEAIQEKLPDCWITTFAMRYKNVSGNYAIGWRLNKNGSRADWYVEARKIFRYDERYSNYND